MYYICYKYKTATSNIVIYWSNEQKNDQFGAGIPKEFSKEYL